MSIERQRDFYRNEQAAYLARQGRKTVNAARWIIGFLLILAVFGAVYWLLVVR